MSHLLWTPAWGPQPAIVLTREIPVITAYYSSPYFLFINSLKYWAQLSDNLATANSHIWEPILNHSKPMHTEGVGCVLIVASPLHLRTCDAILIIALNSRPCLCYPWLGHLRYIASSCAVPATPRTQRCAIILLLVWSERSVRDILYTESVYTRLMCK